MRQIFIALVALLSAFSASAEEMTGELVSTKPLPEALKLESPIPLTLQWLHDEPKLMARITGEWDRADWSILWGTDQTPAPVTFEPGDQSAGTVRKITLLFPLVGEETPLKILLIDPSGKIQTLKLKVRFEKYPAVASRLSRSPVIPLVTPSLGVTYLHYSETGARVSDFSQVGLTGKVTVGVNLFSHWNVNLSGYYTLLPLWTSDPNLSAQYLGLNGRIGYRFDWPNSSWLLNLMGGVYYTNMYVTQDAFGYKNLAGLQLYPVLGHRFFNGNVLSIYAKYSPISDGVSLSFFDLNNRELAFGFSWSIPMPNTHPLSFSVDLSDLLLAAQEKRMQTDSASFSLSYGF